MRKPSRMASLFIGAALGAFPAVMITNAVEDYRNPHKPTSYNWVTPNPDSFISPKPSKAAAPTPAIEPVADTTKLSNGKWTVGVDIPAGTYKVDRSAPANCYYNIYVTGTNYTDLVTNGYGGGQITLTLKQGTDVELNDCGTWHRI